MIPRTTRSGVPRRNERTLFPVAIATCLVLGAILLGVYVSRNAANSEAAESETLAVQGALDNARSAFAAQARVYADRLSPDVVSRMRAAGGPQALPAPQGAIFLADLSRDLSAAQPAEFRDVFLSLAPFVENLARDRDLRGALPDTANAAAWGHERSLISIADNQPWFVAIVPHIGRAEKREGALALLDLQRLDDRALADLARTAGVQRLEILPAAAASEGHGAVRLGASHEPSDIALVWRLDRPGDAIVDHYAFFLLAFASIFAAFIVFHSRRVTMEAVDGEQKARAATGQDLLTGLPDAVLFAKLLDGEVERVKRSITNRGAAVLLFDIDRFKEVNDTNGEEFGDRLIVALSRRVVALLRSTGRIARIDGDEFAILQTDIVGPRDAELLARRVVEAFAEPVDLGDRKIYVSVSIGIALCPHDSDDSEELMRRAGLALYRAKNQGRNGYCFYETRTGEQLKLQKAVEDDLRAAIETGGLLVQYQPVMELSGKRMTGVEALVRWPHPAHGFISPMNFVTLAEECGMILPLGEWVLRRALIDVAQWPGIKVAVNVSGIQLRDQGFVETLQRLLLETGVDAAQLELEVTESVLLADADTAEEAMIQLRAMGVRLALDDFGTGYSSLIYLRRFAFDKIKIDKSFLESMEATGESAIIVHSIVHLGRALGLTVTAEGVETNEQHRLLQALGCHELQGYLFSRPVMAAEITQLLARQNGDALPGRRAVA